MGTAILYEYRRATTLRTTWVFLAISFVMGALTTWPQFLMLDNGFTINVSQLVARVTGVYQLTVFVIASFAALSWGHEFRFGLNRLTLSAFPRRWPVFAAKTLGIVAFSTMAWLVSVIGGVALLQLIDKANRVSYALGEVTVQSGSINEVGASVSVEQFTSWHMLGRSLVFVIVYSLIVGAVTALTRNLTLALIVPNIMMLFAETVLVMVGSLINPGAANALNQILPFVNGQRFAEWATVGQNASELVSPLQSTIVFLGWCVLLLVVAASSYQKRDA